MFIDELEIVNKELTNILKVLDEQFNIQLIINENDENRGDFISEMLSGWENARQRILLEAPYNTYFNDPNYVKATLVCEALRLFLSEIAPVRKGKTVRTKKMKIEENVSMMDDSCGCGDSCKCGGKCGGDCGGMGCCCDCGDRTGNRNMNECNISASMSESYLVSKVIEELDKPQNYNKIQKSAFIVAKNNNIDAGIVLEAYDKGIKSYLKTNKVSDPIYHEAMSFAFSVIKSKKNTKLLENIQNTNDKDRKLYKILINKAKANGFTKGAIQRFTVAASNAILEAKI